jgi:predicted ATPase/DNA-binding winged helix-turn-helix (wHTH) protein
VTTAPLAFGPFLLHIERRLLTRAGEPLALGARALDLLCALAAHRDRVVDKDELMDLAWPGMVVEENNLAVQVGSLRKLLGPQAIATVRGRGYRFVAAVSDGDATAASGDPPRPRTNLPATTTPLIGRAADADALRGWIESGRLVTLVGAGGIGKSRLALEVAQRLAAHWRDGAWLVELAGLGDATLLANAVAQPLGIALREGAVDALVNELANREMLLVLDNCEHLLDAVATLTQRLLARAPGVRMLATSQEPLRLPLEQQYRLDPLAVPADASVAGARTYGALELFVARVRAADAAFVLDDHRLVQAIGLCQRLDGLPLAIELAAARVPLLGLRTVHDRIDERFRLLTAGARTALARHQTLRATMAWSHGLLSDPQRIVFRRLGVFSGGFTMALAEQVCGDATLDRWAVLDHVGALVNKSLVMKDSADPPRYRLLESTRAFALEELARAGEASTLVALHARTLAAFLREVDEANLEAELRTDAYAALVLPELDNLRAAYAWARAAPAGRALAFVLAASSSPLSDYSSEFCAWMMEQRAHGDVAADDVAISARFARGLAAFNMHGFVTVQEACAAAQHAAALYRTLALPRRLVSSLRLAAVWRIELGDHPGAVAALDEAESLVRPDWGLEFRMTLLRSRARIASETGNVEAARTTALAEIALARQAGDWRLEVIARTHHAERVWLGGDIAAALRLLDALEAEVDSRPVTFYELIDLYQMQAALLSEQDEPQAALRCARAAVPGMRSLYRGSLPSLAHLLWRLDRCEAAARLVGAIDAGNRAGTELCSVNERRLLAATRAGTAARLRPDEIAAQAATGASLDRIALYAWLVDELTA